MENGDTDGDGDIDLVDLGFFADGWYGPDGDGAINGSPNAAWEFGDFDEDGDVDLVDLGFFADGWYGPNGDGFVGPAAVPEPATLSLLGIGAMILLIGFSRTRKN